MSAQVRNRAPLFRMTFIRRKILRSEPFTASSIAAELEVQPKTVHRDINFMRDCLNYDITYYPRLKTFAGRVPAMTTL